MWPALLFVIVSLVQPHCHSTPDFRFPEMLVSPVALLPSPCQPFFLPPGLVYPVPLSFTSRPYLLPSCVLLIT